MPTRIFAPIDDDKCKKCSVENCLQCSGNITFDICTFCNDSFYTNYENGTIKSCDSFCEENEICLICDKSTNKCTKCNNISYIIINGKCKLASFVATYFTGKENK